MRAFALAVATALAAAALAPALAAAALAPAAIAAPARSAGAAPASGESRAATAGKDARAWRQAHERAILAEFARFLALPNVASDRAGIAANVTAASSMASMLLRSVMVGTSRNGRDHRCTDRLRGAAGAGAPGGALLQTSAS